ncbi:DUF6056 family protein [Uniformispora flossi]|uniref:DUF6056 family protein n=1 Tax=Uniformispora flossi TaxID=3390723 RepID=UPI003C2B8704
MKAARIALYTVAGAGAALLAVSAFLGLYVRPTSDDWCATWKTRDMGTWGIVDDFWTTQNGRTSNAFVTAIVYADGILGPKVLPALLVVFMVGGLVLVYRELARRAGWVTPLYGSVLLAVVSSCALFLSMPLPYQTLLWAPGTISHTLPFVIALWAMYWALRAQGRTHRIVATAAAAVIGAFMGMLSEPFTVVALALVGVAALFALVTAIRRNGRYPLAWCVATLGGLLVGFGLLYISPGAKRRREITDRGESMFSGDLLTDAYHEWVKVLHTIVETRAYLAVFAAGLAVGLLTVRREGAVPAVRSRWTRLLLVVLPPLLFIAISFVITVSVRFGYGPGGAYAYSRTWFNYLGPAAIALAAYGACLGFLLRQRLAGRGSAAVPVVVLAGAIAAGALVVALFDWSAVVRDMTTKNVNRATAWDAGNAEIRAAIARGEKVVPYVPHQIDWLSEAYETPRPTDWVAECITEYYGVDDIYSPEAAK